MEKTIVREVAGILSGGFDELTSFNDPIAPLSPDALLVTSAHLIVGA